MLKVYVAGPYSNDPEGNVKRTCLVADRLVREGCNPFVPHLTHYVDEVGQQKGDPIHYEKWMEIDFEWLRCCDVLLLLDHSPGADREIELALELGIPAVHISDWGPPGPRDHSEEEAK